MYIFYVEINMNYWSRDIRWRDQMVGGLPLKIGIVGYGKVGKYLDRLFKSAPINTFIYDKFIEIPGVTSTQASVNECDVVFIAVPTPSKPDGGCDTSAVEEVVAWVDRPMCIKSTVAPGTTDSLIATTGKRIVFSPEYVGETPYHRYAHTLETDLVVMWLSPDVAELFLEVYRSVLGSEPRYFLTDSVTAELTKYMENCFFATKVAFVAQFYLLRNTLRSTLHK